MLTVRTLVYLIIFEDHEYCTLTTNIRAGRIIYFLDYRVYLFRRIHFRSHFANTNIIYAVIIRRGKKNNKNRSS